METCVAPLPVHPARPKRLSTFSLVGPILFYDAIRTARRGRYFLIRFLYTGALLTLIWALNQPTDGYAVTPARLAEFGAAIFSTFIVTQLAAVALLTPAYVASGITEEKEGRTLEFLLATDLQSREIVLGKLLARLGNLSLLVLAGLPVLSLLELIGGIDPNLVLAGFAATALTMLGLGGLSVLCSVYARRSLHALLLTYLLAFLYGALSVALYGVLNFPLWASEPLLGNLTPYTLADLGGWICAGNLPWMLAQLHEAAKTGPATAAVPGYLTGYAAFHGLLGIACVGWAIVKLRPVARRQAAGATRRQRQQRARRILPPLRNRPVLWKELHARARFGRPVRFSISFIVVGAALCWILPALGQLLNAFDVAVSVFLTSPEMPAPAMWSGPNYAPNRWPHLANNLGSWLLGPAIGLVSLLFLALVARAAASVSSERMRQTLDSLMTTPLPARTILGDKALACLLRTRGAWWFLAVMLCFGCWAGAITPPILAWVLVALAIYAVFFTALGIWFSTAFRSTAVALVAALTVGGALTLAPWLLFLVQYDWLDLAKWNDSAELCWLLVLNPPAVLVLLTPRVSGYLPLEELLGPEPVSVYAVLGYTAAAALLWRSACRRLRAGRASAYTFEFDVAEVLRGVGQLVPAPLTRRRTLLAAVILAAVASCGWLALHRTLERRLQTIVQSIDQNDAGWRLEELQAARAQVPEAENAALIVLAIGKQTPPEWPYDFNLYSQRLPQDTLDDDAAAGLRNMLEPLADLRRQARSLAQTSRGRFPTSEVPEQLHLPNVVHLLGYDAVLQIEDGQVGEALKSCRAMLMAGRAVGDDPLPTRQVERLEGWTRAALLVERALAQGLPTEDDLRRTQASFEAEAAEPVLLWLLRGERAWCNDRCSAVKSGRFKVFDSSEAPAAAPTLDWLARDVTRLEHAGMLDYMTRHLAILQLPLAEQPAAIQKLIRECQEDGLTGVWQGQYRYHRLIEQFEINQAKLHSTIAALAAKRYRLRHGRWPQALEQLVPEFLARVPLDPFADNRPVHLRRLTEGAVIYSHGPNRRDDGGNVRASQTDVDVGIQLWDSPQRQKPPDSMPPPGLPSLDDGGPP